MKLVEFDLDVPQAAREIRATFRDESRSVSALYERCFPGLKVKRGWKVLVECVGEVDRPGVRDLLGALTAQVPFDLGRYRESPPASKQAMLLDSLHAGAVLVAEAEGWPPQAFDDARRCVLAKEFRNEWVWRRPRWGPGRWYRAFLFCRHDLDAFRAWLVVEDRDGVEIARTRVLETKPNEFAFVPLLGALEWSSSTRVALLAKDTTEVGRVDVSPADGG